MSKTQFHSCASYCDTNSCGSKSEHELLSNSRKRFSTQKFSVSSNVYTESSRKYWKRRQQSISVLGLGECGLSLSHRLLEQGYGVIAVDHSRAIVKDILQSKLDSMPKEKRKWLCEYREAKRLSATSDVLTATKCSDVIFVTPDWADFCLGKMKNVDAVLQLASVVGRGLRSSDRYQLVVFYDFDLFSVLKKTLIHALEKSSDKKMGEKFGACGVIEHESQFQQYATAYIKGYDSASELAIRRVYKRIGSVNTVFDF